MQCTRACRVCREDVRTAPHRDATAVSVAEERAPTACMARARSIMREGTVGAIQGNMASEGGGFTHAALRGDTPSPPRWDDR